MNPDERKITEADLHAYVDGQLDDTGRSTVERLLAADAELAARIEAWQHQNEALHALYDSAGAEPVPPRLDIYRIARKAAAASGRRMRLAAAAVLLLAIGGAGGWYGHQLLVPVPRDAVPLVDEAMAAHSLYISEVVHPVEVRADQKAHLATWLSKRLDRSIMVPDLRSVGFDLVGGRLLPAGGGPAAQFMYEDKTGRRITLFIVPANTGRKTAFRFAKFDQLESFFWSDEMISCALVGDLPRDELRRIAFQAYEQLG